MLVVKTGKQSHMTVCLFALIYLYLRPRLWNDLINVVHVECVLLYSSGNKITTTTTMMTTSACIWISSVYKWSDTLDYEFGYFNSLANGRCGRNFENITLKIVVHNSSLGTHYEIALGWMPHNFTDDNFGHGNLSCFLPPAESESHVSLHTKAPLHLI